MTYTRLSLALSGADELPSAGRVLVLGPRAGLPADVLPMDRVVAVQGFRPDHDLLVTAGWAVVPTIDEVDQKFAAAIVILPRSRSAARGMVATAVARTVPDAPVWIDGQKTDGIDTMIRDLRARVVISAPFAKSHGKITRFDCPADDVFGDWRIKDLTPEPGFVTRPGVFSAERVDAGSVLLAAALPKGGLRGRVVDLGAGWGWLSHQILSHMQVTNLHLVEADHEALACARRNVTDPRAEFHWEDAGRVVLPGRVDAVVMNPPFHNGRDADPALGVAFIASAARILPADGVLYMVANRHLPYESALAERFRDVAEVGGNSAFKLFRAARPIGKPRVAR